MAVYKQTDSGELELVEGDTKPASETEQISEISAETETDDEVITDGD